MDSVPTREWRCSCEIWHAKIRSQRGLRECVYRVCCCRVFITRQLSSVVGRLSASSRQKKGESSNRERQSLAKHRILAHTHMHTLTHTLTHSHIVIFSYAYTCMYRFQDKLTASDLMIFFPMQIACDSCPPSSPALSGLPLGVRMNSSFYKRIYVIMCACVHV